MVCVVVEKYCGGDVVKIDFSTLRVPKDDVYVEKTVGLLTRKYPHVIKHVSNCCKGSIDLKAIQRNPIWNVEPRLLVVDSITDRVDAKSIAEDVLKESFDNVAVCDETMALDKMSEGNVDVQEVEPSIDMKSISVLATDEDEIDVSDEIDWNDI
jgi:hypothetical protein